MKKIIAITLSLALVLSLAACGGKDEQKPSGGDSIPSASQQTEQTDSVPENSQQTEQSSSKPNESKPSESQPSDEEKRLAEKADTFAVSFGAYEGQPIAWRVLSVDVPNERALLITKDCLAEMKFHEDEDREALQGLTWRTSDLRVWLTGEFYFSSFTDEEKERILEVENPQDTNSETGAKEPDGYETTDTVFILSASEMLQYFAEDEDMAGFLGGESVAYWTRTPGNDTSGYVCTYSDGGLYMTGNSVYSTGVAVRPAVWVDLSDGQ